MGFFAIIAQLTAEQVAQKFETFKASIAAALTAEQVAQK